MYNTRRAFTLLELLVVLGIVALLAAVMLPVLSAVKRSAQKTVCLSNFRQAYMAALLYVSDYDDMFMPVNHQPAAEPNAQDDTTWVQMLLPYVRSYGIFRCPAGAGLATENEASFDGDLVPGDIYSRFYSASLRTNLGYNYLYLAPIYRLGSSWVAQPRGVSDVSDPGRMLMFIDSVWDRAGDGTPIGGGNWLVVPPCRFRLELGREEDTFQVLGREVFSPPGWSVDQANSGLRYGRAWPWHLGRTTVIRVEGGATTLSPAQLASGCDVEENWSGLVKDASYAWALN